MALCLLKHISVFGIFGSVWLDVWQVYIFPILLYNEISGRLGLVVIVGGLVLSAVLS